MLVWRLSGVVCFCCFNLLIYLLYNKILICLLLPVLLTWVLTFQVPLLLGDAPLGVTIPLIGPSLMYHVALGLGEKKKERHRKEKREKWKQGASNPCLCPYLQHISCITNHFVISVELWTPNKVIYGKYFELCLAVQMLAAVPTTIPCRPIPVKAVDVLGGRILW